MKQTLSGIDQRHGLLWTFATARYTVAYWAEEEDLDPADCFEFEDDIAAVRSGALAPKAAPSLKRITAELYKLTRIIETLSEEDVATIHAALDARLAA